MLNAIVAFFLPAIVGLVIAKSWDNWKKILVGIVSSLVVAAITAYLSGNLVANLPRSILVILFEGMLVYRNIWKSLGFEGRT